SRLYSNLSEYQTLESEMDPLPGLAPAEHNHQQHKAMPKMVVHSPDLVEDRALVVEEVKPRVAGAELHKVQSDQKHSLDQAEMVQTPQAFEQLAQRIGLRSVDNVFRLESTRLHNYGRFDTDFS